MVLKRVVRIPIYKYKITVIVSDTVEEVQKIYPEIGECHACTLEGKYDSVVWFPPELDNIIHECEHLKNNIWNYIGYTPQSNNDEVDAYLVSYLVNTITKIVIQHPSVNSMLNK